MEKAYPVWHDLPEHFKKDLVQYLDFKSRWSFRCCSKLDYYLVDTCPVFFKKVTVNPRMITFLTDGIRFASDDVEIFFQLLRHPKSSCQQMIFEFGMKSEKDEIEAFISSFIMKIEQLDSFKISSQSFVWNGNRKHVIDHHIPRILKLFDSEKLNSLSLTPNISPEVLTKLFEMEQWKKVKGLRLHGGLFPKLSIEHFLHFNYLSVRNFGHLSPENCWKVIQNFLHKNCSRGYNFSLQANSRLAIDNILELFSVPIKNEPFDEDHQECYHHTQIFEIPKNPENVLVVAFSTFGLYGAVCRKTYAEVDFSRCFGEF